MNAQPPDGGPAFPESASGPYPNGEIVPGRPGMTLRDWFAGMAIAALWNNRDALDWAADGATSDSNAADRMASAAYTLADKMLAAREQKEGGR